MFTDTVKHPLIENSLLPTLLLYRLKKWTHETNMREIYEYYKLYRNNLMFADYGHNNIWIEETRVAIH